MLSWLYDEYALSDDFRFAVGTLNGKSGCAAPRVLLGVGEELGVELLEEKWNSDFSELSGVHDEPCELQSNRPTALREKLEVASLMIRNQGGILASTVTLKLTICDLLIGRREFMWSWSNEN